MFYRWTERGRLLQFAGNESLTLSKAQLHKEEIFYWEVAVEEVKAFICIVWKKLMIIISLFFVNMIIIYLVPSFCTLITFKELVLQLYLVFDGRLKFRSGYFFDHFKNNFHNNI